MNEAGERGNRGGATVHGRARVPAHDLFERVRHLGDRKLRQRADQALIRRRREPLDHLVAGDRPLVGAELAEQVDIDARAIRLLERGGRAVQAAEKPLQHDRARHRLTVMA